MANRFQTPVDSTFINTYTPIPFEDIIALSSYKQNLYDQGLSSLNTSSDALDAYKAITGSKDEEYLYNLRQKRDEIVDKYAMQDLSDLQVQASLKNDMRKLIDKTALDRITGSYGQWVEENKSLSELMKKGQYNPALFDPSRATGWDSSTMGQYQNLAEAELDFSETALPYFNELDNEFWSLFSQGDYDFMQHGVGLKRIQDIAANAAPNVLATEAGQQLLKKYAYQMGISLNDLTAEEAVTVVYDALVDYGKQFAKNQVSQLSKPKSGSGDPDTPAKNRTGSIPAPARSISLLDNPEGKQTGDIKEGRPKKLNKSVDQIAEVQESNRKNLSGKYGDISPDNYDNISATDKVALADVQAYDYYSGMAARDANEYAINNGMPESISVIARQAIRTSNTGMQDRLNKYLEDNNIDPDSMSMSMDQFKGFVDILDSNKSAVKGSVMNEGKDLIKAFDKVYNDSFKSYTNPEIQDSWLNYDAVQTYTRGGDTNLENAGRFDRFISDLRSLSTSPTTAMAVEVQKVTTRKESGKGSEKTVTYDVESDKKNKYYSDFTNSVKGSKELNLSILSSVVRDGKNDANNGMIAKIGTDDGNEYQIMFKSGNIADDLTAMLESSGDENLRSVANQIRNYDRINNVVTNAETGKNDIKLDGVHVMQDLGNNREISIITGDSPMNRSGHRYVVSEITRDENGIPISMTPPSIETDDLASAVSAAFDASFKRTDSELTRLYNAR